MGRLAEFDVIGSSWRDGAVDPTPEYFRRVLDACGCVAADVVLHDNPVVISGAIEAGVPARLLSGPA